MELIPSRTTSNVLCLAVALALSACATSYGPQGLKGGYSHMQLDATTFRVDFKGNGFTSRERVEQMLFFRCADLTVQSGYDYFVILSRDGGAESSSYTTPGTVTTTGRATATTYGRSTYVQGTSTSTYTPGQTYDVTK